MSSQFYLAMASWAETEGLNGTALPSTAAQR